MLACVHFLEVPIRLAMLDLCVGVVDLCLCVRCVCLFGFVVFQILKPVEKKKGISK